MATIVLRCHPQREPRESRECAHKDRTTVVEELEFLSDLKSHDMRVLEVVHETRRPLEPTSKPDTIPRQE